jgi:hypothetical protein
MAKHRIDKPLFTITGRNYLVLFGTLLEGTVSIGMHILREHTTIPIIGVEMADSFSTRESWVCLLIGFKDEAEREELKALFTEGEVIEVV